MKPDGWNIETWSNQMNLSKPAITIDENRTAVAPVEALLIAADVLEEEANQLAEPNRQEKITHRANIAIMREISRLRTVADALRKKCPKPMDDEE
jgi:serine phosphatase RsbU (regulator of sigma subunit)